MIHDWIVNARASEHMTTQRNWFSSLKMIEPNTWGIDLVKNQKLWADDVGTIHVNCLVKGSWDKRVLKGILYMPFMKKNLFSIGQTINKGLVITYRNNIWFFINVEGEGKVVMIGIKSSNLYKLQIKVLPSKFVRPTKWLQLSNFVLFGNSRTNNSLQTWHNHFGHIHFGMIMQMTKNKMVTNMPFSDKEEIKLCEGCALGKIHHQFIQQVLRLQDPKKLESFFIQTFVVQ